MNEQPGTFYKNRIEQLRSVLIKLKQSKLRYAWLRFLSFLLIPIAAWLIWPIGFFAIIIVVILSLSLFFRIVKKDLSIKEKIKHYEILIQINQNELLYPSHQYFHFPDGKYLEPEQHPYANDLDIFGKASLYQYINRTTSEQGNKKLRDWLLFPASMETIRLRQEAITEITKENEWRQWLQAYGMTSTLKLKTETNILYWVKEENKFLHKSLWNVTRFILPLMGWIVLSFYLFDIIPEPFFYTLLLLLLGISLLISKKIMPEWIKLGKITDELDTLSNSLEWIENKDFKTGYLQKTKSGILLPDKNKASLSIKNLKKILDRFDYRLNPVVFIPLSIFLAWDLQQIFALERWKEKNQLQLNQWFDTLAEFEALSSIGTLSFNHPEWILPSLINEPAVFIGEEVGHPLIPAEKRIANSFSMSGVPAINLVTGSNMAGKSTFLRSVGVNIVLAMMGSPVCAKSLTVSPMKVMSSMRISDNLEESTSTFYAELKKLKEVIDAVNNKEEVFLLLDEILRGTNSADRHAGSKALIEQLIRHDGAGIIATHDLELAKLEKTYPEHLHNYHFDVQVAGEELYFDYKLKEGVCQSMNASILMKKIGIEITND